EVERMTVRQVAAVRKVHSEDGVAGLQDRQVDGHVGLASRMWLDVHMLGAEKFFGAFNRQVLNDIHKLATAVVAAAGISFGVLVGEYRSGCLEHGAVGKVLGRNQFQTRGLAALFVLNSVIDVGIQFLK